MHFLPLLIPLAGGALSFALPEPNGRNVPQNLRHKVGTKHDDCDPCEEDYHNGDPYNNNPYNNNDPYNNDPYNGDCYNGDCYDEYLYPDPNQGQTAYAVLPASASRTTTSATTASPTTVPPTDETLDDPEVDFLPTIASGFYFDDYLDEFFGYYDFSDASFPAALEDLAPGLSSYNEDDYKPADLPVIIIIGGRQFSTNAQFCMEPPCDPNDNNNNNNNNNGLQRRTPQKQQQLPKLDPKNFASTADLLEEIAIRQETELEFRQWQASQSPPKKPPTRSELLSAAGIEMIQRQQARDLVIARRQEAKAAQASSEAASLSSKAAAAQAAAATGDAAKAVQIVLDRKTVPILPGSGGDVPVQAAESKAEPLVIGKKVAEAAAGIFARDAGKLRSLQDQARSAALKAQAAPKPTGGVARRQDDPTVSSSDNSQDFSAILSSLLSSVTQQPNAPDSDEGDNANTSSSAVLDDSDSTTTPIAIDADTSSTANPAPTKRPSWLPGSNGGVLASPGNNPNDTSSPIPPTHNNDPSDFTAIISALIASAFQTPNTTSSSSPPSPSSPSPPDFGYSAITDVTGTYFLAADNSGTLGLTTAPPSADAFAWKTFALFKGALAADARRRLFVYFPETMDALGVSRFRLAALNETAFDARAAAVVPVSVGGGGSSSSGKRDGGGGNSAVQAVLVPVDTAGAAFAFVACNVMVGGGVTENKLFVVKDQDAGARTLLDRATREEVTGGDVSECFPVALRSPLAVGM